MSLNLFAGIAVEDFGRSLAWYRKLLRDPVLSGTAERGVEPR